MRRIAKISIVALTVALAACASSGVKIDQAKIEALQKGKTTYAEAIQSFGKPTSNTVLGDGSRMVFYNYFGVQTHPETFIPIVGAFVGGADTEHSVVTLTFDKSGVLKDYSATEGGSGTGTGFESLSQNRKDVRAVE